MSFFQNVSLLVGNGGIFMKALSLCLALNRISSTRIAGLRSFVCVFYEYESKLIQVNIMQWIYLALIIQGEHWEYNIYTKCMAKFVCYTE